MMSFDELELREFRLKIPLSEQSIQDPMLLKKEILRR
jgi:hypothetical protein